VLKFKEKRKKNQKSLESSESRRIFALSKTNKHFQTKKSTQNANYKISYTPKRNEG
jgi:hypothetical protein